MATRTLEENPAINAADQAEFARLVDLGKTQHDLMEAAATNYQKTRQAILAIAKDQWFEDNAYAAAACDEPVHRFDARGRRFNAQIDFNNKYVLNDERLAKLKEEFDDVDDFFRKVEVIKISMDQLPVADHQAFFRAVVNLCNDWNIKAMIGDTFEVHEDFHVNRHAELDEEDNKVIDAIVPVHAQLTYGG
ncbi:MAG: hypothetical protein EBU46_04775 [Nitrosomonadaceae bacterium]|nr:hypothetical protein [Nitrosomonadaceae bacterium]